MDLNMKNRMVARFKGWELSKKGRKMTEGDMYPHGWVKSHPDYLFFHFSWNWLMPVICKISQDLIDEEGAEQRGFDSKTCQLIMDKWEKISKKIHDELAFYNDDITTVFECVVEFIEWYNNEVIDKETYYGTDGEFGLGNKDKENMIDGFKSFIHKEAKAYGFVFNQEMHDKFKQY